MFGEPILWSYKQVLTPTAPPVWHSNLIGAGRGIERERLLMGTDRTWKRNKARQKRNVGVLDLMMRVLSAPLRNGFSLAMPCVCEVDGWWRGWGFFTCWSFLLCLRLFCPFVLSSPSAICQLQLCHPSFYSIFPTVMLHSSFLLFFWHLFPRLGLGTTCITCMVL